MLVMKIESITFFLLASTSTSLHPLPSTRYFLRSTHTYMKKFWTHEIPSRKKMARCHNSTRSTRPTMTRDSWNLAHSIRADAHMTSMKIVQFSRPPPHPLFHPKSRILPPLDLGHPISNEPRLSK